MHRVHNEPSVQKEKKKKKKDRVYQIKTNATMTMLIHIASKFIIALKKENVLVECTASSTNDRTA